MFGRYMMLMGSLGDSLEDSEEEPEDGGRDNEEEAETEAEVAALTRLGGLGEGLGRESAVQPEGTRGLLLLQQSMETMQEALMAPEVEAVMEERRGESGVANEDGGEDLEAEVEMNSEGEEVDQQWHLDRGNLNAMMAVHHELTQGLQKLVVEEHELVQRLQRLEEEEEAGWQPVVYLEEKPVARQIKAACACHLGHRMQYEDGSQEVPGHPTPKSRLLLNQSLSILLFRHLRFCCCSFS